MSRKLKRYELFFGNGGHGGPYHSLAHAIYWARQLLFGSRQLRVIYVKPYVSERDGYGPPIATVRKHEDGTVTHDGPKGLRFLPQPMDRARRLLRESVKYLDRDFHPEKTDDFEKRVRAFLKEQL